MTIKRRHRDNQLVQCTVTDYPAGGSGTTITTPLGSTEELKTFNHPGWSRPNLRKRIIKLYGYPDIGGGFYIRRRSQVVTPTPYIKTSASAPGSPINWFFEGRLCSRGTLIGTAGNTTRSLPTLVSTPVMHGKGIQGWSTYKPTASQANIGQGIGELRSIGGLPINPQMIRDLQNRFKAAVAIGKGGGKTLARGLPRDASSGYLAYQFGIRPFVKDVQDLVQAVMDLDKNLKQLARDNGRSVRRSGTVSKTESSDTTSNTGIGNVWRGALTTQLYKGVQTIDKTTNTSQRFWFSGRFRYMIDPSHHGYKGIPDRERFQLTRILFGLDPSDPTLYYELMPWSWLLDWFVPMGSIIDNLFNDSVDKLTADYAYIMCETRTEVVSVSRGFLGYQSIPITATSVDLTETKQRNHASPYGFGLSYSGFSLKQLAILAALGHTRFVDN